MQLKKIFSIGVYKVLIIMILLVFLSGGLKAETQFELLNNALFQGGHGGKQVYDGSGDQSLTMYMPSIFIDSQINSTTSIGGSALFDMWSGASEKIFDAATGASTQAAAVNRSGSGEDDDRSTAANNSSSNYEYRTAFELHGSKRIGSWAFAPNVGYSYQPVYKSINEGLNIQKFFADDNFVLSAGFKHYDDTIDRFSGPDNRFVGWTPRTTNNFEVTASQILSRSDIILIGLGYARQTGLLSSNRNTVDLNNDRVDEVLPSIRNKYILSARYVHGFSDNIALHLDYRFYDDSWAILAHTIEPSIVFAFDEDNGFFKVLYRFYDQSATRYYKDSFSQAQTFMTSDSDLAKFYANEVGAQSSYKWDMDSFMRSINLGGTALYYVRSNDLHALIFQVSIGGSF